MPPSSVTVFGVNLERLAWMELTDAVAIVVRMVVYGKRSMPTLSRRCGMKMGRIGAGVVFGSGPHITSQSFFALGVGFARFGEYLGDLGMAELCEKFTGDASLE